MNDYDRYRMAACGRARDEIRRMRETGDAFVGSGIPGLDETLIGFKPGDLAAIVSAPGEGKSLLALAILSNAVAEERRAGFISLEADETALVKTLIAMEGRIPCDKLQDGLLERDELDVALSRIDALGGNGALALIAERDVGVKGLCDRVTDLAYRSDCELVVVDGLALVRRVRGYADFSETVSEAARSLKRTAMFLGIPVIATLPLRHLDAVTDCADAVISIATGLDRVVPDGTDRFTGTRPCEITVLKNRIGPAPVTVNALIDLRLKRIEAILHCDSPKKT